MKAFENFTGLYPLSKTLRFELKPIGRTLEYIEKNGLLDRDKHRANSYVKVKKIIDRYHKQFIEDSLRNFKLIYENEGKKDSLEEYFYYYKLRNRDEKQKKDFDEIQKNLRKQIASQLKKHERFKRIDKKELIKEDLLEFVDDVNERNLIDEFKDFTTYFTGFHENRQNMYSDEAKSTAIAYRLIHENLPKFIDNISVFERVAATDIADCFAQIYSDFEEYLNVNNISEIFRLDYYTEILTQTQIDVYNLIIGGRSEGDVKIKGLNEYINLYNQQQKDKSQRLPKLKPLFKQILSDRNAISWLPDSFENDNDLLENLEKCIQSYNETSADKNSIFARFKELLLTISEYEIDKIFIRNDLQLTDISQKMFGNYNVISKALYEDLKSNTPRKSKKETDESYEERLRDIIKKRDSFSIAEIDSSLQKTDVEDYKKSLCDYFAGLSIDDDGNDIFDRIEKAYSEVKELLNTPYQADKNLAQEVLDVDKIKNLLESIKELQKFVKPLCGKGDESDKDERFYGEFTVLYEELDKITPLYNMVRNYLTRKPYSTEKIKLNFDNSTLLDGWDLNKESDNTSVILRKDGLYYLAIMNKKHNKVFAKNKLQSDVECFEKMEYKLFKDLTTMVPKCTTQLKEVKEHFEKSNEPYIINKPVFDSEFVVTKEEYELNNLTYNGKKKFQKDYLKQTGDENGYRDAVSKWIRFCLRFLSAYKSTKIYDISVFTSEDKVNSYSSVDDFYSDINLYLYKLSFVNVSVDYVNSLVEDGKIYLFQIYSKDFSPFSKGTPNMHTLYWKMLFDKDNLKDVVYKLNGQAEVFFRKSSIRYDKPTHPAKVPINNKNVLNHKKQSVFDYDLIKDKRYSIDKFQFHVPITINFKSDGNNNINPLVNEYIKQSEDLHIIGIDRGERHLLYLTVIDMKGNIKKQFSLNEIVNEYKGNIYSTNYHDLLDKREKKRDEERKRWHTIETIKELKEGYLSQVIHKITELMVEYNAIIVLEDLNLGFMRGRQKVEKSVYQKFEKMLIDKLNYLADKKKDPEELGGVLKAYQLSNNPKYKVIKQSGFLFYTQAWNTSKIDPVTGFVNLFDTHYENILKSKNFFSKFDLIKYNSDKDWFEFSFDYNNFTTKAEGTKTKWTLCTFGNRIISFRNPDNNMQWDGKDINLTEEFKLFFEKFGININSDLQSEIVKQDKKEFFEGLLHLLRLTLQLRNSKTGTDIDYMQSPVADENGAFYNSDECGESLPENADANGAYNIARKGLMIIDKIKKSEDLKKIDLKISNKEWLSFAQNKPYLKD